MKNSLTLSSLALLFAGSVFAANYTAISSGNWNSPETWGQDVNIPGAEDTFTIGEGVTVDITSAVAAKNIQWVSNYTTPGVLNVMGEDASLTLSTGSSLFYQYMMVIDVSDKATVDIGNSSWGNGGYYKINVDNATLNASFNQLQGSKFLGENAEKDSGIYLTNNSIVNSTSGWSMSVGADEHVMNLLVDNSSIVVGSGSYFQGDAKNKDTGIYMTFNKGSVTNVGTYAATGENSRVDFILKDGSSATGNGFQFHSRGLNSVANLSLSDSSFTGMGNVYSSGEGSQLTFSLDNSTVTGLGSFTATGNNSSIEIDVSNGSSVSGAQTIKATGEGAKITQVMTASSYVTSGDNFLSASGANASVSVTHIAPVSYSINNIYMGSKDGASVSFTLKDATLKTGNLFVGSDNYSDGNTFNDLTKFANGNNELILVNSSLELTGNLRVLAYNNTTSKVTILGSKITQSANSLTLGVDDVASGGKAILQFGGFDGETFIAAQAGSYYVPYEFKVLATGEMRFVLGASNLTKIGEQTQEAIFSAQYLKPIQGDFVLDLSNISGLESGEYMVALMECVSGENMESFGGMVADYNALISDSAIESDTVKLFKNEEGNYFEIKDSTLYAYVSVSAIPEPGACAAVLGALALAFAAYRRRK